ncbi:Protein FAR1-RELATED SEQUENCE 6 [Glycine max]|nr:Protein FAR1-RELATED SEQUENCE 6 [Glycine max]
MDKVCLNSEAVPVVPAVGMEFDSYEDVYYFYNWYANEQGFGVRFTNTWYRKTKERYRAKLSCSSAGFKKRTEANRPRPETRTGFPAMIKFRMFRTLIVDAQDEGKSQNALYSNQWKLNKAEYQVPLVLFLGINHHKQSILFGSGLLAGMFPIQPSDVASFFFDGQINADGPVVTYIVQEQVEVEGNQRDARDYEVCYNEAEMEVLCICGLFNFRGCLCRHALFILSQNEIKEIPAQYILLRWRKGQAVKVVEEGKKSHDHYRTAVHDVIGEYIEQASSCKR